MTPLEVFRQIWTQTIPAPPYVDTVNQPVETDTLPTRWASAIIQPQTRADVSLGSQPWVEENGFFLIGLFTRSGKGPADLDAAVDAVRAGLHGAALNGLNLEEVDGPHDIDPQADGEWWRLALTAKYTFQTRRNATGPLYGDWVGFPNAPPP
jgi:hypothetical protein